jgi:molecular chaperone GrpE
MIETELKETLIAQFSGYLDSLPEAPTEVSVNEGTGEIDLYSLFIELAALKNEVKLEGRQVKGALDQFREVFGMVEQTNQRLSRELDRAREAQVRSVWEDQRPLLLGILELRDRIEAGLDSARAYRPGLLHRLGARPRRFQQGLLEGMEITLRRVDELLARYRVQAISAIGQRLNPHTMHAAGIEHRADRPEGCVLSEVRKGYLRGEEVLRPAEVIVNKEGSST